jgi:hypothetical protein
MSYAMLHEHNREKSMKTCRVSGLAFTQIGQANVLPGIYMVHGLCGGLHVRFWNSAFDRAA